MSGTDWGERLDKYAKYVTDVGVAALEGYNINLDLFEQKVPQCVEEGLLTRQHADYVLDGLRHGFELGVRHEIMSGSRVHKNYSSAYEHKEKVQKALSKRVKSGKTLKLSAFAGNPRDLPLGGA